MDLRIGDNKRIRLLKAEYERLLAFGSVSQKFTITDDIQFEIEVMMDPRSTNSFVGQTGDSLRISVAAKDVEEMASRCNSKNGITIGDFSIQVDLWDDNRRKKD